MQIANYNKQPSKMNFGREALSLYVYTLLADEVLIKCALSYDLALYDEIETLKDEEVIRKLLPHVEDDEEFTKTLTDIWDLQKQLKRYIREKHTDKSTFIAIGNFRSIMKDLRSKLKEIIEKRLKYSRLFELVPFRKEDVWKLENVLFKFDPAFDKQDLYITELTQTIPEQKYLIAFDTEVEKLFSFCLYDNPDNCNAEIIKIPLWSFPVFDGISFFQMKFTRDYLLPALLEFKAQLKKLSSEVFNIPFEPVNHPKIKQLCQESIEQHIVPVQKSVNDSLYMSQLRNKTEAGKGINFCLGITSAENLVNYYERTEMIEPYVATEIKQQIGRQMDLKACCFFVYCTF